jgi:hypothetical protein
MPNNENYAKNPYLKLTALLKKCGWLRIREFWEKESCRLLVDEVGIFLFRWQTDRWVRSHGLAYVSMRNLAATRRMVFADQSSLCLESGSFSPAPAPPRKRR